MYCLETSKILEAKYRAITVEYEENMASEGPIGQYCLYQVIIIHIKAECSKCAIIVELDQPLDEVVLA